jgi:hypothetical protein
MWHALVVLRIARPFLETLIYRPIPSTAHPRQLRWRPRSSATLTEVHLPQFQAPTVARLISVVG